MPRHAVLSDPASFEPPRRPPAARKALLSHLRAFDRHTREFRRRAGDAGRVALDLLEALAFRLCHPATGRCVASYAEIGAATGRGRSALMEAARRLEELGVVRRHRLAGLGPWGQGANGWEFCDPVELFRRLFRSKGVHGADPTELPKRKKKLGEIVLAEVEAPADATAVMTDAEWDAAAIAALARARTGLPEEPTPCAS